METVSKVNPKTLSASMRRAKSKAKATSSASERMGRHARAGTVVGPNVTVYSGRAGKFVSVGRHQKMGKSMDDVSKANPKTLLPMARRFKAKQSVVPNPGRRAAARRRLVRIKATNAATGAARRTGNAYKYTMANAKPLAATSAVAGGLGYMAARKEPRPMSKADAEYTYVSARLEKAAPKNLKRLVRGKKKTTPKSQRPLGANRYERQMDASAFPGPRKPSRFDLPPAPTAREMRSMAGRGVVPEWTAAKPVARKPGRFAL